MSVKMNVPRIEFFLNENSKLCIAKVEQTDADARIIVDIDLNELKSHGLDGASSRLGGVAINLLSMWHKSEFEDWNIPAPQENPELGDFGIAQCLIGKSMSERTRTHVQSIDALLRQAASKSEDAKRFLDETWPVIRERVQSFDNE